MARDRDDWRNDERRNFDPDDRRYRDRPGMSPYSDFNQGRYGAGFDRDRYRREAGYGMGPDYDDYLGGTGYYGAGADYYGYPVYGYYGYPGYGYFGSGRAYGRRGYHGGQRGYGGRGGYSGQERGFWDKAGDEVSSWFGDEEAERRRQQDQFRGRGPRGYTRSDDRIQEDVNDRLTDDWSLDASDVEVSVSNCEVTLNGQVSSRDDKRHAEDLVDSVSGVRHVQNNLRVRGAMGTESGSSAV
jgi:osmotically-inducible protein OsmY